MGFILSWVWRTFGAFLLGVGAKEGIKWVHDFIGSIYGLLALLGIAASPKLVKDAAEKLNKYAVELNPVALGLAADTLTQITGVGTRGAWLAGIAAKKPDRINTVFIGEEFFPVVTNMFDIYSSRDDARQRTPQKAWEHNLNAFFGTNLLFQMRSLTISTIARMTGLESLRHLEGLHQTINWAFGFGWLSWAVMSNYMDVTINDQMKKSLNAVVRGKDMTLGEAIDAANKGYLTPQDEKALLDNYGLRDEDRDVVKSLSLRLLTVGEAADAHLQGKMTAEELDTALHRQAFDRTKTDILLYQRQKDLSPAQAASAFVQGWIDEQQYNDHVNRAILTPEAKALQRQMAEKELSDAELQRLWQEQLIDDNFLTKEIRHKGFGAEKTQQVATLWKNERYYRLQDEYVKIQRRLFVDCVIEEAEIRTILTGAKYTQQEMDQAVLNDLAARRTRQFLPTTDMFKAVKHGLLDVNDAVTALQCRGWTYDDAIVEAILRLEDKLPACEDVKLEEKALIGLMQALGASAGISGKLLKPNILKYLQCLNLTNLLLPPIATLTADRTELTGVDRVILTWKTTLATSATIEPVLGPVPLEGSTGVDIKHSEGFRLTAKSPIGTTYATVFINVKPA